MGTDVPSAKWRPNHNAVSPKAMNITPDKKSLLRNRLNDASPTRTLVSQILGSNPEPTQPLDKHDSHAAQKRQVHARRAIRTAMAHRQSANDRRNSTTGARLDQRAAMGATKSAGNDSAATQNIATSPTESAGRPGVCQPIARKAMVAGRETSRLNRAPAPMARRIGKENSDRTGVLNVPPPMPSAAARAPTSVGGSCAVGPVSGWRRS